MHHNSLTNIIVEIEKLGTMLVISAINEIDDNINLINRNDQKLNVESIYKSRASIKIILVVLLKVFFQRFRYNNK